MDVVDLFDQILYPNKTEKRNLATETWKKKKRQGRNEKRETMEQGIIPSPIKKTSWVQKRHGGGRMINDHSSGRHAGQSKGKRE